MITKVSSGTTSSRLLSKTTKPTPTFTRAEVAQHSSDRDLWLIISNKVYDFSGYAKCHPGGAQIFYSLAGKDATQAWHDSEHPFWATGQLSAKCLGDLVEDSIVDLPLTEVESVNQNRNDDCDDDV